MGERGERKRREEEGWEGEKEKKKVEGEGRRRGTEVHVDALCVKLIDPNVSTLFRNHRIHLIQADLYVYVCPIGFTSKHLLPYMYT